MLKFFKKKNKSQPHYAHLEQAHRDSYHGSREPSSFLQQSPSMYAGHNQGTPPQAHYQEPRLSHRHQASHAPLNRQHHHAPTPPPYQNRAPHTHTTQQPQYFEHTVNTHHPHDSRYSDPTYNAPMHTAAPHTHHNIAHALQYEPQYDRYDHDNESYPTHTSSAPYTQHSSPLHQIHPTQAEPPRFTQTHPSNTPQRPNLSMHAQSAAPFTDHNSRNDDQDNVASFLSFFKKKHKHAPLASSAPQPDSHESYHPSVDEPFPQTFATENVTASYEDPPYANARDLKGLKFWNARDDESEQDHPPHTNQRIETQGEVTFEDERHHPLKFIIALGALTTFAVIVWLVFQWSTESVTSSPTHIEADNEPFKIRPDDPGGLIVPHQDKLVYSRIDGHPHHQAQVEHVLPPPEAPIALPVEQHMPAPPSHYTQHPQHHVQHTHYAPPPPPPSYPPAMDQAARYAYPENSHPHHHAAPPQHNVHYEQPQAPIHQHPPVAYQHPAPAQHVNMAQHTPYPAHPTQHERNVDPAPEPHHNPYVISNHVQTQPHSHQAMYYPERDLQTVEAPRVQRYEAAPAPITQPSPVASPSNQTHTPIDTSQFETGTLGSTRPTASNYNAPSIQTPYKARLASLDTKKDAEFEWSRLSRKYPDLFRGKKKSIVQEQSNGKTFYVLYVLPLNGIDNAKAFCKRMGHCTYHKVQP